MNETSVHVVITDVRKGDRLHASSVVNVPSGVGLARFRAAALSECCRFVNRPCAIRKHGDYGCRVPTGWTKASSGAQTRQSALWNHRSRDGGTESRSGIVNWGPSARRKAGGISHKSPVADRSSDGVIVSDEAGGQHNRWRSQGPLGECVVSEAGSAAGRKPDYGIQTRSDETSTVVESKFRVWERRVRLTARLKPYWGKPAVRNLRGGRGNVGTAW